MSLLISTSFTQRENVWTVFKSNAMSKNGVLQYDNDGTKYTIWFYDGPEVHVSVIWTSTVPEAVVSNGYTQAENDADKADFEANYKPTANASVEPKSIDGRAAVRTTITSSLQIYKLRVVLFYTGTNTGLRSVSPLTGLPYGDVTMFFLDANGIVVPSGDPTAVTTVVDWDALYAFELIGGWGDVPGDLLGLATNDWTIACVGVPDYPHLAVDFCAEIGIEALPERRIQLDGRSTQYLSPTIAGGVNYHTNRIRWIVKHPAGVQKRFQIFVETFA